MLLSASVSDLKHPVSRLDPPSFLNECTSFLSASAMLGTGKYMGSNKCLAGWTVGPGWLLLICNTFVCVQPVHVMPIITVA